MLKQDYFDSTYELFVMYRQKMNQQKLGNYTGALALEVLKRLNQLSYIYRKLKEYEQVLTKQSVEEAKQSSYMMDEVEIYTEAFYYFAFRIYKILKNKKFNIFPGLNSFDAPGVRNVRNFLIEHPDISNDKAYLPSISLLGTVGPVLKIARRPDDERTFDDPGLWVNAAEFKNNLEKLLRRAVSRR